MQQTTDGEQPTKRGQSASSLRRHLQCIMGKTMDFFPRSKNKNKRVGI